MTPALRHIAVLREITMPHRLKQFLFPLMALSLLFGPQKNVLADELFVSAAASLTDVLKELSGAYQARSKHTVKFNLAPPAGLRGKLTRGRRPTFSSQPICPRWTDSISAVASNPAREKTCCRTSW
jgi:hypothetical protein